MAENETVYNFLEALADADFWGAVTVKFENGHIVHIRREESLKPNQLLPEHRRYQHEFTKKNWT